jgi:hypothetical protein
MVCASGMSRHFRHVSGGLANHPNWSKETRHPIWKKNWRIWYCGTEEKLNSSTTASFIEWLDDRRLGTSDAYNADHPGFVTEQ